MEKDFGTPDNLLSDTDSKMNKAIEVLKRDLVSLRTGRATPALMDNLVVEYYGVPTPISQLSSISTPEARLILIQPWDKQSIGDIEKAILKSDLGLNPSSDGNVVRIPIPQLSHERRLELVKVLKRKIEDGKLVARNIRRDCLERLRDLERNKGISQDENRRSQESLQKLTDACVSKMDEVSLAKESEIMQV